MQLGKHVYVQKPLTRTISEARALTEAARKYKVVTQMGNQGHSEEGLRLMQEWFDAGAIGEVREVHCWTNRPIWPQGMPRPTEEMPVPEGMDWDLWLGAAPPRPFHKTYHPSFWRAWQDFGAGAMGDMACHVMDASYTVLKLGAPTSIIATAGAIVQAPPAGQRGWGMRVKYNDSYPPSSLIHLSLPAARQPAAGEDALVRRRPAAGAAGRARAGAQAAGVGDDLRRQQGQDVVRDLLREPAPHPRVGDAGVHQPAGRRRCRACRADATDTRRTGSTRSARTGQAVSHFDYAGPFTESVLLGNLALRFPGSGSIGTRPNMKVTNVAEANQFVQPNYRSGWTLPT